MKQILAQGAHSVVYIDTDNPNVVIKENITTNDDGDYLRRQRAGYDIINQIVKSGRDVGVALPRLIEMFESGDRQVIKEQLVRGNTFDTDGQLYSKLSQPEKNIIAKQMATFLVAMHSSGEISPATKSIKTMFEHRKLHNATEITDAFQGYLPHALKQRLDASEKYLDSSDISDEVRVLTHRDLRSSNLMYDADGRQLAVLDFELARPDNVYRDFVAEASASVMPWDFTTRVIREYNAMPNKKYPIKINPEKVQNMLVYAIMHEFARCVRPENFNDMTEEEKKDFDFIYHKIKLVAGVDIKSEIFKAATKGIKPESPGLAKIIENDDR